jgi:hypothetical protein
VLVCTLAVVGVANSLSEAETRRHLCHCLFRRRWSVCLHGMRKPQKHISAVLPDNVPGFYVEPPDK